MQAYDDAETSRLMASPNCSTDTFSRIPNTVPWRPSSCRPSMNEGATMASSSSLPTPLNTCSRQEGVSRTFAWAHTYTHITNLPGPAESRMLWDCTGNLLLVLGDRRSRLLSPGVVPFRQLFNQPSLLDELATRTSTWGTISERITQRHRQQS